MRSQREHTHHWNWPRRQAVEFAPGHTGTHQRCYCGASRIRNVTGGCPERKPETLPVVRREVRKRLIDRPRIGGGAGVTYFWVGGTGTWDGTTTTHWATSTGGAGGAGVPTSTDNATFDTSSGLTNGTTVTVATTAVCSNFTVATGAVATVNFTFQGNFTASGTCSIQGNSAINRLLFQSSAVGTQRTLTLTTVTVLANVDFMDSKGAGGLSTFAGTSIGDALGNATITFTVNAGTSNGGAGVNRYWVATSGGSWSLTTSWSTTDGGSSGASVPLPQDDVYFTALSITSGSRTITANVARSGRNITMTNLANTPTLSWSVNWNCYGNFTAPTGGLTSSGTSTQSCRGRGAQTFTSNGVSWTPAWQFVAPAGTYTIQDNYTSTVPIATTYGIQCSAGTLTISGALTITASGISLGSAGTLNMGVGATWALTATGNTGSGNFVTISGTLNAQSATITLSDTTAADKTFAGSAHTFYAITVNTITTNAYIFTGGNHYGIFTLTAGLVKFSTGNTHTFTNFKNNGAGGTLLVQSNLGGTQTTLAAEAGIGGFSWKGVTVQDITTSGSLTIFVNAGTNTSGNGAGVVFTSPARTYARTQSQTPTLARGPVVRTFTPTAWGYDALVMAEPLMTSYWRLDDAAAPFVDDMGLAALNGFAGITPQDAGPLTDPSLTDYGVTFDGATGYCSTPYLADLNPATFTMEAWVKPTNVAPATSVDIIAARPSNTGFAFAMTSTGTLFLIIYDGAVGTSVGVASTKAFTAGVWYHVAATFDGTTVTIYINGALAKQQAFSTFVPNTTGATFVGRNTATNQYWPGSISRVAMWPYALDGARIAAHYQAGVGAGGQGQVSHEKMNPGRYVKQSQSQTPKLWRLPLTRYIKPSQSQAVTLPPATQTHKLVVSQGQSPTLAATQTHKLVVSQGQSPTLAATQTHRLVVSQGQSAALLRNPGRYPTPSGQAQTPSFGVRTVSRPLPASQAQAVARPRTVSRYLPVSQSQALVLLRTVSRLLAVAKGQAVTLLRGFARGLALTQGQAVTLLRGFARGLALTQGQAVTPLRTVSRLLAVAKGQAVTLSRGFARGFAPTQGQAASVGRAAVRNLPVSAPQAVMLANLPVRVVKPSAQSQAAGYARAIGRAFPLTQAGAAKFQRLAARWSALTQDASVGCRHAISGYRRATQAGAASLGRGPSRAFTGTQGASVTRRVSMFGNIATSQLALPLNARAVARGIAGSQSQACYTVRGSTVARAASQGQLPKRQVEVGRLVTSTSDQRVKLIIPLPPGTFELAQDQAASVVIEPRPVMRASQAQASVLVRASQRTFAATQPANPLLIRIIRNAVAGTQVQSAALARARAAILTSSQLQARTRLAALARRAAVSQAASARLLRVVLGRRSVTAAQSASVSAHQAASTVLRLQQAQSLDIFAPPHGRVHVAAQAQIATTRREIAIIYMLRQHQALVAGRLGRGWLVVVIRTDALDGSTTPFSDLGVGTAVTRLDTQTPRRELVGTASGHGGAASTAAKQGMLAEVSSAALRSEASTGQLAASVEKRELSVTTRRKRL